MQTIIHNAALVALCCLISAAVLVLELAIAARLDKRRIHARRELTRQM
jgi:hypothetical protein